MNCLSIDFHDGRGMRKLFELSRQDFRAMVARWDQGEITIIGPITPSQVNEQIAIWQKILELNGDIL